MRVFIGFDARQPIAYHVCRASVERYAKGRVQVEPVRLDWLPITRRGLTDFTFARYLVPWLCDFNGPALFLDADIVVRADVRELLDVADPRAAVSVVQGQRAFEWPSVMFFRCDAAACKTLTPEWVNSPETAPHTLGWARDRLGALPPEWNFIVGYDACPSPEWQPKIVHYTAGIPCWRETEACEFAEWWHEEFAHMRTTVSWEALMGQSVHRPVVERMRG